MPHRAQYKGFTLLELMIAVAIMGILIGMAAPAFSSLIRNNRTATHTNNLITALKVARSEANKRGLPVSVCTATNPNLTACSAPGISDWANGWITFTDGGTLGSIDGTDTVLVRSTGPSGGVQVTNTSPATPWGYIRFGSNGASTQSADVRFSIRHSTCIGNNLRTLQIFRNGQVGLTKANCP